MASKSSIHPILVLGSTGQVGHELLGSLAPLGHVIGLPRHQADLSDPDSLRRVVRKHKPAIIVNAAAFTAVDRAETDGALAQTINGFAPGVLAEEARALGATIVHYSTDYVYDGSKPAPYCETDVPNPLSVYGQSKLAGDLVVARYNPRHLIFRTSWVFGAHGANFLKTMLRLGAEREELRVVADQLGAPTSASLIATVTAKVLQDMSGAGLDDPRWGLYHSTAGGETSWHQYACFLLAQARERGLPIRVRDDRVLPITTAEFPTPAVRPLNSRLDTMTLRTTFELTLPDWRQGVQDVLDQLGKTRPQ